MWIISEYGHAANITRASALYVKEIGMAKKIYYVDAVLPGFDSGNFSGDSEGFDGQMYGVSITLKEFNNEDDAKKYIAELVEKLNAEKN